MKFKEALDLVQEVKPLYKRSAFGEALDIICSAAELAQQHLTQVKTPAAPTPEGEICRCEDGNRWHLLNGILESKEFCYCPTCGGKLQVT